MYLFGLRGHAPNYPMAMRYFENAVAQGNDAVSMDYLGMIENFLLTILFMFLYVFFPQLYTYFSNIPQ